MTSRAQTLATLRATGHRITPQRQIVLDVITTSRGHLDAEAIFQRARHRDPNISLATVYRTLTVLKDRGLIQQRYLARGHSREHYEPVGAREHYHFACLSCRKVIEFQSPRVKQMTEELRHTLGVDVAHACICFEGYCQACEAKREAGKG